MARGLHHGLLHRPDGRVKFAGMESAPPQQREIGADRGSRRVDRGRSAQYARVMTCLSQGAKLRTHAEETRHAAEEALRRDLSRARKLGIPVADIARTTGLSMQSITELSEEPPSSEPRRSRA
jgi:hypothetical protein